MDTSILKNASERCNRCKHHIKFTATCKAYPDRIPKEILTGEVNHTKPYKGDRGIQFEK